MFSISRAAILTIFLGQLAHYAHGQAVFGTPNTDAVAMAKLLLNPSVSGVKILNATFAGNSDQLGTFIQNDGELFAGLGSTGLLLSSGVVQSVELGGPGSIEHGTRGNDNLDAILQTIDPSYVTCDSATLSIKVSVPRTVTINVNYVFGSNDYQYAVFPDVLGLFVDHTNVALINGSPVSAVTVYCDVTGNSMPGSNCDQYINNFEVGSDSGVWGTSLLGYTRTQTATMRLTAGIHDIVVAVADGAYAGTRYVGDAAGFFSFQSALKAPTTAPIRPPTEKPTKKPVRPTRGPKRQKNPSLRTWGQLSGQTQSRPNFLLTDFLRLRFLYLILFKSLQFSGFPWREHEKGSIPNAGYSLPLLLICSRSTDRSHNFISCLVKVLPVVVAVLVVVVAVAAAVVVVAVAMTVVVAVVVAAAAAMAVPKCGHR
jgi:hypothetical protein